MHRAFMLLCRKVGAGAFVAPTCGCSFVAPFSLQDSRWACSYSPLPRSSFSSFNWWVRSVLVPWWRHWLRWWAVHFIKVGVRRSGPVPSLSSWVPRLHLWDPPFLRLPPHPLFMHLSLPSVYPVDVMLQHGSEDNSFAQTVQPVLQLCKFRSL